MAGVLIISLRASVHCWIRVSAYFFWSGGSKMKPRNREPRKPPLDIMLCKGFNGEGSPLAGEIS